MIEIGKCCTTTTYEGITMMVIKVYFNILILSVLIFLTGCGGSNNSTPGTSIEDTPITADTVRLSTVGFNRSDALHISSMPIDGKLQLTAEGIRDTGEIVNLTNIVTWTSSNSSILTVTPSGVLETHKIGTAKAIASFGNATFSQSVDVDEMILTVLNFDKIFIPGNSAKFTADIKTIDNGFIAQGDYVTWESSDPTIAAIDASGLVQIKKIGDTIITARFFGVSGVFNLSVASPLNLSVDSTTLNSNSLSWNTIPGVDYYRLTWDTVVPFFASSIVETKSINNIVSTQYIHEGLNADIYYRYKLEAIKKDFNGRESVILTSEITYVDMPSNNAAILSGDVIGTGQFDNTVIGKTVPLEIANPISDIQIESVLVDRFSPDFSRFSGVIIKIKNISEINTYCNLYLSPVSLIDSAGVTLAVSVTEARLASGIRTTNTTTIIHSTCIGPRRSGYLNTSSNLDQLQYDNLSVLKADKFTSFTPKVEFPKSTVTPLSYTVIPANAVAGTKAQLKVVVKNTGSVPVKIGSYTDYILLDSQGNAVYSAFLKPITGWSGDLAVNQSNVLVADIGFTGSVNKVYVFVDY